MTGKRAATVIGTLAIAVAGACALDHEPTTDDDGSDASAAAPAAHDAGSSEGGAAPDAATLAVELGTGSSFFVPLHDGDAVTLVRGKQGFQHVWISARVSEPDVREAIVTISTHLGDGRPGGPSLAAAVELVAVDGGVGSETVGLTGLVDYAVIGQSVRVRLEVKTTDGLRSGADERLINVLPPVNFACTSDGRTIDCQTLCAASSCSACETGSTAVGFITASDASATIDSCAAVLDAGDGALACCCCR
jgi:hypothetical protein